MSAERYLEPQVTNVAQAFRTSDGAGLLPDLIHCLDFMNGLPFFTSYKAHTWQALAVRNSYKVLDVGCGIGFDVIEMAKQHPLTEFWGVDISEPFLEVARIRAKDLANVRIRLGDADNLSFDSNYFDGTRIDRSLQHMENPRSVIGEMIRVTRANGHIVASEPDWGTFVVHNGELRVGMKLAEQWRGSFRNPYIGRELGVIFADQHVKELEYKIHSLCLTNFDSATIVFDLKRVREHSVEVGAITREEAEHWWSKSGEASIRGSFLATLDIFEVSGTVAK